MEDAETVILMSSRGSTRFFTLVVLSTSITFLTIAVFPTISNKNPQYFMRDQVQNYDLEKPEVVNQRFAVITALKSEEVGAIYDDFTVIWSNAKTEFQKYDSYGRLYGILWAKYNVTKDIAVRGEMNEIEQFMALKWPQLYKTDKDNKGFIE